MAHASPIRTASFGVFLVVSLVACKEKQQAAAPKPERPVLVQRVRYEPRVGERSFVGTVRPRIESDLAFRVPGKWRGGLSASAIA